MSATKTLAFVLKTQDYRDTSVLATFYTRDFGKIRGIVRGIRDARGRFGSTLEPFSLNEILFYRRRRGGDLHQVTQVELVDLFDEVRGDLERLAYASYFTELLDELVEGEESGREVFDLLSDALSFLSSGASPRRAARIFEVKLLGHLGIMPEIRSCVKCGAEAPDPSYFSVPLGGIRCKNCGGVRNSSETSGLPVSKGSLNFLDHIRRAPVKELQQIKVSQEVGEEVQKMMRRFVDFHLHNKLNSVVFLEKMELA